MKDLANTFQTEVDLFMKWIAELERERIRRDFSLPISQYYIANSFRCYTRIKSISINGDIFTALVFANIVVKENLQRKGFLKAILNSLFTNKNSPVKSELVVFELVHNKNLRTFLVREGFSGDQVGKDMGLTLSKFR